MKNLLYLMMLCLCVQTQAAGMFWAFQQQNQSSPETQLELLRSLNLYAAWHMDEESGMRYDCSGNGYNLTSGGLMGVDTAIYSDTGKWGNAVDFANNPTQLYNVNMSGFFYKDYCISVWFKFKNDTGDLILVMGPNGASNDNNDEDGDWFEVVKVGDDNDSNRISFGHWDLLTSGHADNWWNKDLPIPQLTSGEWHHACYFVQHYDSWERQRGVAYLDGVYMGENEHTVASVPYGYCGGFIVNMYMSYGYIAYTSVVDELQLFTQKNYGTHWSEANMSAIAKALYDRGGWLVQ